jgi:pimeloyl-ACP methyl ester carboxylesterase
MAAAGAAELRAATAGRKELESLLASTDFDPEIFTPEDHAALSGTWRWLGEVAGKGMEGGPGGMVDDDLAYVAPWRFELTEIRAPVLLLHGGRDRVLPSSHDEWLARQIPSAELWLRPEEGHISVLKHGEAALEWLREHAAQSAR